MKYGMKDSGHERKSPEGLAVLGYRGTLQWDEQTQTNRTLTNGSALICYSLRGKILIQGGNEWRPATRSSHTSKNCGVCAVNRSFFGQNFNQGLRVHQNF